MHELTRSVRFCLPVTDADGGWRNAPAHNTFAAWPSMRGIGVFYAIDVTCRGEPDPHTGYLVDIRAIDESVRRRALEPIGTALRDDAGAHPGLLLRAIAADIREDLGDAVAAIRWHLTPYYSVSVESERMDEVVIRQQFDFSAAHRLHAPELSDEENHRRFGKCNNPNGHGHNYRLEVAVRVPLDGGPPLRLEALEAIVDERVLARFDHRHLNLDTPEFRERNPSVEHIAKTIHGLLEPPVEATGATLDHVVLWETEKTSCRYPAS